MQHTLESLRKETVALREAVCEPRSSSAFRRTRTPRAARPTTGGISQAALRTMRAEAGDDMLLIADLCLCEYTDHGHCGVFDVATGETPGRRPTSTTTAPSSAIAPSPSRRSRRGRRHRPVGDDGRQVAAIRDALDGARKRTCRYCLRSEVRVVGVRAVS